MENVSLTISKDIVNPIVQAKINEAIIAAMGGHEMLIEKAIKTILYEKVNKDGNRSTYNSDNTYTWIDVVITKQIEEAVKESMKALLSDKKDQIKEAIMRQLSSKKSIEAYAAALLDSATKIQDNYYSTVKVEVHQKKGY